MNRYDGFSDCHPAVNFLFFVGAIGFGVVIQHPAYVLAGLVCAAAYAVCLSGKGAWKLLAGLLPLLAVLTLVNPLLNTQGSRVLATVFGRHYTLEALLYGGAIAGILAVTVLWFHCFHLVLTSDKFISLFGSRIPALSLLLVMVLRLVPHFLGKARQILGARQAIGRGMSREDGLRQKVTDGGAVLSVLTSWALEGGVVTADSMRSRGYGTGRRTAFQVYRMTGRDMALLMLMGLLAAGTLISAASGGVSASFTPVMALAPVMGRYGWGLGCYTAFLLIPTALHWKETMQWNISKSKI